MDYVQKLNLRLKPILDLLQKQALEQSVTERQPHNRTDVIDQLVQKQQHAALQRELKKLNSADIAHLIAMLPSDKRLLVWGELSHQIAGEVILELTEGVAESLIEQTDSALLSAILSTLDADELSEIADLLSDSVLEQAKANLAHTERNWLEDTLSYPEGSVGNIMSKDSLVIFDHQTIGDAIDTIRAADDFPPQTDKLLVINRQHQLVGIIPLFKLIRHQDKAKIIECMDTNVVYFRPSEDAEDAGQAFERYDLVSAPVVDDKQRVIGRLTVESIMDHLRDRAEMQALAKEGLSADTDVFGPVLESARERWPWLCINLLTAFVATRFISIFEGTIQQLVALATLMPIVASVGGNTGNQTAALLIRALAMNQVHRDNIAFLFRKELIVSLLNGLLWGGLLGIVAGAIYKNLVLGVVMTLAIIGNLILAALIGVCVPLLLEKLKRDPAMGSSVVLTFATDSMGFFIFLGLASLVLV